MSHCGSAKPGLRSAEENSTKPGEVRQCLPARQLYYGQVGIQPKQRDRRRVKEHLESWQNVSGARSSMKSKKKNPKNLSTEERRVAWGREWLSGFNIAKSRTAVHGPLEVSSVSTTARRREYLSMKRGQPQPSIGEKEAAVAVLLSGTQ